jgi:hypothetical protein
MKVFWAGKDIENLIQCDIRSENEGKNYSLSTKSDSAFSGKVKHNGHMESVRRFNQSRQCSF